MLNDEFENNKRILVNEEMNRHERLDQKDRYQDQIKRIDFETKEKKKKYQEILNSKRYRLIKCKNSYCQIIQNRWNQKMKKKLISIKELQNNMIQKIKQQEQQRKKNHYEEMNQLQNKIDQDAEFSTEKEKLESLKKKQEVELLQLNKHNIEIQNKEMNEQKDLIDQLKKNMLKQIQDTKKNLLTLKKDQFDTQTRMTIHQNNQFNYELQFQSHQIEKILLQNQILQQTIKQNKQELQLHKEIQRVMIFKVQQSEKEMKIIKTKIENLNQTPKSKQIQQQKKIEGSKQLRQFTCINEKLQNDICLMKKNIENQIQNDFQMKKTNLAYLLIQNLKEYPQDNDQENILNIYLEQENQEVLNQRDKGILVEYLIKKAKELSTSENAQNPNIQIGKGEQTFLLKRYKGKKLQKKESKSMFTKYNFNQRS